jgi:tetratricopeptide (TPR) repeat protein
MTVTVPEETVVRSLLRIAFASAACAAVAFAHARLPDQPAHIGDEAYVPHPRLAKLASVGFDVLMADYYWLRAVQIVGSPEGPRGRNHHLGSIIDVVTTLDPWVDHPYRFAAVWLVDDEPAVRQANRLLERGIEHHPDEWRNRFYLGFNHFFYLGEEEIAAQVLEPAVKLPGAPRYLGRLVARLRSESGSLDAAAAFLHELVRQAPDGRTRAEYEKALDEIETERRARRLDAAREAYRKLHGRDIARVEDLVPSVLPALPPEPHGWEWKLSEEDGRIVSSFVGHRYEIRIDGTNQKLLERFRGRTPGETSG